MNGLKLIGGLDFIKRRDDVSYSRKSKCGYDVRLSPMKLCVIVSREEMGRNKGRCEGGGKPLYLPLRSLTRAKRTRPFFPP